MDSCALGDFPVSRIGFGARQLPGPGLWGPPRDRGEAVRVLRRAVQLGVDRIDTAQYCGPGVASEHERPDLTADSVRFFTLRCQRYLERRSARSAS